MSAPHIILDNLPSLCQKLSDLVEVWRSYNKNNFACFFDTRCICCFSIFPSSIIDSESGVTICNQYRIRRLDTWRHRVSDHSTHHRPLPTHWRSFGTKPLSPAIFEIMGIKHIGGHDLDLSGSGDVIIHMTIWFPGGHFLYVVHCH